MRTKWIQLDRIVDVYEMVNQANKCAFPAIAHQGHMSVPVNSLMGMFAINPADRFTIEYDEKDKDFEFYISQFEC